MKRTTRKERDIDKRDRVLQLAVHDTLPVQLVNQAETSTRAQKNVVFNYKKHENADNSLRKVSTISSHAEAQ